MNLPEAPPGSTRIGVAIAIPEPFRSQLQQAREEAGDPLACLIPPHITLLGPTVVADDHLGVAEEHLTSVARNAGPFRVHLRGSASFRPISPVVFVQVVEGIAECEQLERAVRSGPLRQDLRFNYHPHVTVAHEVPEVNLDSAFEAMASYEAQFPVEHIHLYAHGTDNQWRPQRQFALGAF